jgi:hypothetical protein
MKLSNLLLVVVFPTMQQLGRMTYRVFISGGVAAWAKQNQIFIRIRTRLSLASRAAATMRDDMRHFSDVVTGPLLKNYRQIPLA